MTTYSCFSASTDQHASGVNALTRLSVTRIFAYRRVCVHIYVYIYIYLFAVTPLRVCRSLVSLAVASLALLPGHRVPVVVVVVVIAYI